MAPRIIVIGGGPAGYVSALRAAQLGGAVTLVEARKLGGTCLHCGCIPTKALLKSAQVFQEIQHAEDFGILAGDPDIDYGKILSRKDAIVGKLHRGIAGLLDAAGVTVISGHARFSGSNQILVTQPDGATRELEADRFIIATGSQPILLSVPGLASAGAITSDSVFQMTDLPDRLLILGGGIIGVEFATLFSTFGAEVTIVEIADRLVPTLDEELSQGLFRRLQRLGIKVLLRHTARNAVRNGNMVTLDVDVPDGQPKTLEAEQLLLSVGRRANIENLGLEAIGITVQNGCVPVDLSMRTNLPHILAAGDVTGGVLLAHVASREGEIAAESAMGLYTQPVPDIHPGCVFTIPEIGVAGLTEAQAKAKGFDIRVGKFPFSANGKAMIENETEGFVKLVSDAATDRILGVHIFGPHASVMIGEGTLAIHSGMTLTQFASAIRPHPTLEEALTEAALQAHNLALHLPSGR